MKVKALLFGGLLIAPAAAWPLHPARADGPGLGTHVPDDAPRDYEPGITANDFYGLLDSALHKNFESLIMVFGGCFAGDFATKLPLSEVGKAGKPAASMTATGTEKDQLYEQTPGTIIGNAFIEGVNDGWTGIDPKELTSKADVEEAAFKSGAARVANSIKNWNDGLPPDEKDKFKKLLKETHPANKYVNGGNKLTLAQKDGAKKYAIIFVGQPETAQDWRDYSNVFVTLNDEGYEIQGFFGSGKRSEKDHTALLPNGHSILEDATPDVKTDPVTHARYGGHTGNFVTNYSTDVPHRKDGKSWVQKEEVTIPFGPATTDALRGAMAKWKQASGESCAVFYFTAFGHFLPVLTDRTVPLKLAQDDAPNCDHHSYRTRGSGGGTTEIPVTNEGPGSRTALDGGESSTASVAQQSWYYCDSPAGYYPTVATCSSAWRPVAATASQDQAPHSWYYCTDPAGYYPTVATCSTAWQPVPATPTVPAYATPTPLAAPPATVLVPAIVPSIGIGIGIGGGRGPRRDDR